VHYMSPLTSRAGSPFFIVSQFDGLLRVLHAHGSPTRCVVLSEIAGLVLALGWVDVRCPLQLVWVGTAVFFFARLVLASG
jgi:hypothetical protein